MPFLKTITAKLLDRWAGEHFVFVQPFLSDQFNYVGPPDPLKWEVYWVGNPTVDGTHLQIGNGERINSLPAFDLTYGNLEFVASPAPSGGFTARLTNLLDQDDIRLTVDNVSNSVKLWTYENGTVETTVVSFPFSTNQFLITWTKEQVQVFIDGILKITHNVYIHDLPAAVRIETGSGVSSFDYIETFQAGRARIRLIRGRRKPGFPDYIELYQADAILTIVEGHGLPLSEGVQITANGITYLVKKKMDVIARGEVLLERWALYRDMTPPQAPGGLR